jgi:cellulose synthase operon protein C
VEPSAQERAFGAEVERCRAAAGVSQSWVAGQVGLARSKISEMCGGRYLPSREVLDSLVIALAMDQIRAVELWGVAVQARRRRRAEERAAAAASPSGWKALPPLPAAVRAMLRAQVQSARELPYSLPGARKPSLETVYVRQELGTAVEDPASERSRPEPVVDARGMARLPAVPVLRLAVRPPARTLRDVLDSGDHLLVTGGPGQGKSTMSLRLAADVARIWETGDHDRAPLAEPVVPLRVTARELAARLDLPFPAALAGAVRAEYGGYLSGETDPAVLGQRVAGCRWLLLVDGVDEVASAAARDRLVAVLAAWATDHSPYRMIVTTRPVEGGVLAPLQRAGIGRYELHPFDAEALRRFAANWFGSEGADTAGRFVQQVRAAYLDELVRVPLLATIAAIIFEQRQYTPLPDNQYELYEAYLAFLRRARPAIGAFDPVAGQLLEHLGTVRVQTDTSLAEAATTWISEHLPAATRSAGWRAELTSYLAAIGPLVIRAGELRFLHHSFAEHLSATATARHLPNTFDPDRPAFGDLLYAAGQGDRGRHARAVLLHYARLQPGQADAMLRHLCAGDSERHRLAADLLSQHLPAGPDATEAFLTVARSWANTTHYRAAAILAGASRATHHAGLTAWLAGILSDTDAAWPSRIEAAAALATRLRSEHAASATTLLRAAVDDHNLPAADRVAAAEALADGDPAERQAAESGLRALLTANTVSAQLIRDAAVTLAGLGPSGREDAVAALQRILDSPQSPTEDLVHAATGLSEIGAEFHDLCAGILRSVLASGVHTMDGREEAAIGLAALGTEQLATAVDALIAIAADPLHNRPDRRMAAGILPELGARHRPTAAGLIRTLLDEPGVEVHDRVRFAQVLGGLGAEYAEAAATELRLVATDLAAHPNHVLWAIVWLSELGPDFRTEAVERLQRMLADPRVTGYERAKCLSSLVRLAAPSDAAEAVSRLRALLSDHNADPVLRIYAAYELIDLGPEHHGEATGTLTELSSSSTEPDDAVLAAGLLAGLGPRHADWSVRAVQAAMRPAIDRNLYAITNAVPSMVPALGSQQRESLANTLLAITRDQQASAPVRAEAAGNLVLLGRAYHQAATASLVSLLHRYSPPELLDVPALERFLSVGPAFRHDITEALRELLPDAGSDLAWQAIRTLRRLGDGDTPEVESALPAVTEDPAASADIVQGAALLLGSTNPAAIRDAVGALRNLLDGTLAPSDRESVLLSLAPLEDVVPDLRTTLTNQDAEWSSRHVSATVLALLRPALADEAMAQLQSHFDDEYSTIRHRTDVAIRLGRLDPAGRSALAGRCSHLLDDEDAPYHERANVAECLMTLDPGRWHAAVATLRRLWASPMASPSDQRMIIAVLTNVNALSADETSRYGHGIVNDPSAQPVDRYWAAKPVSQEARIEIARVLLADRCAPVTLRVPGRDPRYGRPLLAETAIALREVIAGSDSTTPERIQAASALAGLSSEYTAEGGATLLLLARRRGTSAIDAATELAKLSTAHRRIAGELATKKVADPLLPRRERLPAALLIDKIGAGNAASENLIRQVAADRDAPGPQHVAALVRSGQWDGLGPARARRDDPHTPITVRWQIANALTDRSPSDRTAAADLFNAIAADPTAHPALRRRAAADLANLGIRGRRQAVGRLRTLCSDHTLPASVRINAARDLAYTGPSRAVGAAESLRRFADTPDPRHRHAALAALGPLDPAHALPKLRAMAHDTTLTPAIRRRCARTLAQLRRDERDTAAMVARALMQDAHIPDHIRQHAARDLARWNELCRAEALSFCAAKT